MTTSFWDSCFWKIADITRRDHKQNEDIKVSLSVKRDIVQRITDMETMTLWTLCLLIQKDSHIFVFAVASKGKKLRETNWRDEWDCQEQLQRDEHEFGRGRLSNRRSWSWRTLLKSQHAYIAATLKKKHVLAEFCTVSK